MSSNGYFCTPPPPHTLFLVVEETGSQLSFQRDEIYFHSNFLLL